MNLTSLDVLQFLKDNNGLHNRISIAQLVDKEFPSGMSFDEAQYQLKPLYRLLAALETEEFVKNLEFPSPNGSTYTWEIKKNILMELTAKGDAYLRDNLHNEAEFQARKSSIEDHQLNQEFNKFLIENNRRMLDVAIDQAASSSTVAANTTLQTRFMKKQTNALLVTAVFALGALIISYKSCAISRDAYNRDTSKSRLEQSVKKLQIDTSKLHKRLIQIKIDSSRLSEEVKTLKEKK